MNPNKTNRNTWVKGIFICLMMILVTAFKPGIKDGSSTANAATTVSATMYTLAAANLDGQTDMDEIYIGLDNDRVHIYQRGSSTNAVFYLGTFPILKNGNRLEISISEQNRQEARDRLAKTFDIIASKIKVASSTPSDPAPADIAGLDIRLETIQMFFDNELADFMAVKKALEAFDNNSMQVTLDQIQDIKEAYISESMLSGDPTTDLIRTKARLSRSVAQLLASENIRNVFYEMEIMGSLLNDMDAVDRKIIGYYAYGAKIAREESTSSDQTKEIDKIAFELEQLEKLSVIAVQVERQYSSFMTLFGFEETSTVQDQGLVTVWNAILWGTMMAYLDPHERDQYEIQSAVCQPLDRLVAHCFMAGDAARALRTLKLFDNLASQADGNTQISLERTNTTWTCSDQNITIQPVLDSNLTDWRMWEQWANEIDRRI